MRKHVVYPCFLTPCLSIPVICLSPYSQELSAFWGSDFSCGGDSARWVLLRSDHAALSLCSAPSAQSIGHGRLHTQPGLSRFRPGHAGRCWPGAGRSKRRTHASWRTLLTVPSHRVPCCGSSTSADLQHHSILRTFCSFLLHSVGCCEMEVLTQSHSCATRLTPCQLRVQGLQPEALPNKASFALGFS